MKEFISSLYNNRSVEEIIFSVVLLLGIPYFLTNEVIDLMTNQNLLIGVINCLLIFTIIYLLRRSVKGTLRKAHIFAFSLMLIIGFALFWPSSTGLSGAGAYVFQSLIVVLLLVNTGYARIFFAASLVVLVLIAGFAPIEYTGKIVYSSQLISFVINTVVIALVMNLFKVALDKERGKLMHRIKTLDDNNQAIKKQNTIIKENNKEIERIQSQLQQIIEDRTQEIEKENQRLIEYAFINAHLVRAPLANMLGLQGLVESKDSKQGQLKEKMEKMDQTVRKIGGILSVDSQ